MKKCFLTGVALLLPLVLTLVIVLSTIELLTQPFLGPMTAVLTHYELFNKPYWLFSGNHVLLFSSKVIILVSIGVIAFLVGLLGQFFFLKPLGKIGDYILHHIPFVKRIYKTLTDLVHTLFAKPESGKSNFSSVVLVPFPHNRTFSIGLITREQLPPKSDLEEGSEVSVFIPGAPNPSMGFMLLFRRNQLIALDIGVDDALRLVVSCGMIWPFQHPKSA